MTDRSTETLSPETSVPAAGTIWAALGLVVVYVLLAAGLGNLLGGLVGDDQAVAAFALSHFVPLPIAIALLLFSVSRAGRSRAVWLESPTATMGPRRWWLVSIPALALLVPISQLGDVAWADRTVGLIVVAATGTLLVGLGEELLFRGVLLTAVRGRHGEFVTMLVTALVFALAHIPGSVIAGVPVGAILLQVGALAATGVTYYWVRRVTGRLWVGVAVHALTDWVLYVASGAGAPSAALTRTTEDSGGSPFTATVEILLWVATAISVISVLREDRRARK